MTYMKLSELLEKLQFRPMLKNESLPGLSMQATNPTRINFVFSRQGCISFTVEAAIGSLRLNRFAQATAGGSACLCRRLERCFELVRVH